MKTMHGVVTLVFNMDQITKGESRDQFNEAIHQINVDLQRQPYGLGAQLYVAEDQKEMGFLIENNTVTCDECGAETQIDGEYVGAYFDVWDEKEPTYHYECCSKKCENKLLENTEYCPICKRELHELQEHPKHPPRGLSMVQVEGHESLICRRCAEKEGWKYVP